MKEVDPAAAEAAARDELARCGAAVKEARTAEDDLTRCAFGIDACEPDEISERTKELDRAREAPRLAVERGDALVAGPAQRSAASIGAAQRAAAAVGSRPGRRAAANDPA